MSTRVELIRLDTGDKLIPIKNVNVTVYPFTKNNIALLTQACIRINGNGLYSEVYSPEIHSSLDRTTVIDHTNVCGKFTKGEIHNNVLSALFTPCGPKQDRVSSIETQDFKIRALHLAGDNGFKTELISLLTWDYVLRGDA